MTLLEDLDRVAEFLSWNPITSEPDMDARLRGHAARLREERTRAMERLRSGSKRLNNDEIARADAALGCLERVNGGLDGFEYPRGPLPEPTEDR
jgi:hypothetical protein